MMSVPLRKCLERKSGMRGRDAVAPKRVRMVDAKANVCRDRCGTDGARSLGFLRV